MSKLATGLQWQLAQYEDPILAMNQLCLKRIYASLYPIPPNGAIINDPGESGLQIIIDNNIDPLDIMIFERSEKVNS